MPVSVLGGVVLGVLLQVLQHGGGEALRCSVSETLSKMSTMISSVLQNRTSERESSVQFCSDTLQ